MKYPGDYNSWTITQLPNKQAIKLQNAREKQIILE